MGKTIRLSGFPRMVAAELVVDSLEEEIGHGTVVALEVNQQRDGVRAYATVQFTDIRCAEKISNMASNRQLYYDSSYLKVYPVDKDMVQNVRTRPRERDYVTLNLGCQISSEKFLVLWKASNVSVEFRTRMKKMQLFLTSDLSEYKLELSYENIWQIVRYHRPNQRRMLHIQLFGAPRISKRLKKNSIYSYYMDTPDDQWIRTTDFTPSSRIGQSSGMCLELHDDMELPNSMDNFCYFKESERPFHLETGVPFCRNLSLVPIVHPPGELNLPYKVVFKVCSLVQNGCIPGHKLDANFFRLVNPQRVDIKYIEHALDKLYYLKECCYDPVPWLLGQYEKYRTFKERPKSPTIQLESGLVYVHRVQVTPCKIYFLGPEVNVSNRVLRHYKDYIDNFLRVSFVDEELEKIYSTDLCPRAAAGEKERTKLYKRVLSTVRRGIKIGDKKFDFLAFSKSQLQENSLWMFAATDNINADDIRRWMGDFCSIRNVAKYAARLGQSFGSSVETLSVAKYEVEQILDIKALFGQTRYNFSDGIGKISPEFAREVALKCGVKGFIPSAFQIRYRGYKGVVAVDPNSQMKLSLRWSMWKYQSDNIKLDVLAWSKYQPCFLNRQIITLLSTLGVKDHIFEKMQREAIAQLDGILVDPVRAQEALGLMSPGENTNILKELLKCGYKPNEEPFLSMMLQTFRSSKLLDLRVRSRIFVPKARQMMGCLDETGTLEYGQVFVQFSTPGRHTFDESITFDGTSSEHNFPFEGNVVVAKNPCLHPGDVRVLEAVDVAALHHLVDCVVFPSKGPRPHPNECSGSDLDGDLYFVTWDPDLIPLTQDMPMDYDPAPIIELDHDVIIEEVEEYFTNYIVNDCLGIIANAHTVFADKEPSMAHSNPCIKLAALHSIAVDFPKTGIPAEIPPNLRPKEYPDFMEKPDKKTYKSLRVIGKLFSAVKDIPPHTLKSFTEEVARNSYDLDMEVEGFENYIEEAFEYKTEYDLKLGNLMDYYGIKTEAEILSGSVMKTSRTFDRRKDADAIRVAVRALRNEARSWFKKGSDSDDAYAKASAWYHVTYHRNYWGAYNKGLGRDHYISFPWCAYDKLILIKKGKLRRAATIAKLGRQLRCRLRVKCETP